MYFCLLEQHRRVQAECSCSAAAAPAAGDKASDLAFARHVTRVVEEEKGETFASMQQQEASKRKESITPIHDGSFNIAILRPLRLVRQTQTAQQGLSLSLTNSLKTNYNTARCARRALALIGFVGL